MEPKFTPGPWKLFNRNGIISIYKNNKEVIKWTGFDSSDYQEDVLANAHLIAAAPDLFKAGKSFWLAWRAGDNLAMQVAALDLETALAKATGATP